MLLKFVDILKLHEKYLDGFLVLNNSYIDIPQVIFLSIEQEQAVFTQGRQI
jgi:hypothetical protein